jgi:DNA-binding CsgD family transcriptional regulator
MRYKSVTMKIQKTNKFSTREKECANLLMKGYSISQISKELSLKKNTISTYKMRIHKKTNTVNLVQLLKALYALKE